MKNQNNMRQYPYIYSQRDPVWATHQLGSITNATIGQYGCLLSCHAMKAGYYGDKIEPNALNDIYTQRNLYISGDLLSDADLHAVFSDIILVDARSYIGIPADMAYLKQLAQDPDTTVTIEIDFDHDPNDGIQTHFVELHEFDGTNLTIYDPWYGSDDDFTLHYGNNPAVTIQKIAVYKGTATAPSVAVDSLTFQKLVTNSTSYDSVCDELGEPHNTAGPVVVADIAKLKSDKSTAEQTISTLNQQLPELRTANETLTGQVEVFKQKLQAAEDAAQHPETGQDYKSLYEQAESSLKKIQVDYAALMQKTNRQIGQLQTTSATTMSLSQLWKLTIARSLHLS